MPTLVTSGSPTLNGDSTCTIDDTGNDRVRCAEAQILLDEAQGWAAARCKMAWPSAGPFPGTSTTPCMFHWGDAQFSNRIVSYWGLVNNVSGVRQDNSSVGASANQNGTWATNDLVALVFAWTPTGTAVSINGAAFTTSSSTVIPGISNQSFDIGNFQGAVNRTCVSPMLWFACGRGVLTNTDAATLNGLTDFNFSDLPAAALPVMRWTCDTFDYEVSPWWSRSVAPYISAHPKVGRVTL